VEGLGPTDAVVLEASTGSFWWADQIEAKALWVHVVTGEFGIPVEAKERLATEILLAGEPLRSQVELLISIKGVTLLVALAFLADVADVQRVRTLRKMNAYLGLVPRAGNSGGKSRPGHITRESACTTSPPRWRGCTG